MEVVRMPYLVQETAAELDLPRAHVRDVINTFFGILGEELAEGNEVTLSPYVKFKHRVSPAIKKGTLVWNPASGEKQPSEGRPARIMVRATVLSALKKSAPTISSKPGKALLAQAKK